ncbi:cordon-bleu protein-like 1 isoform X2 [Salarias fasciatus]|nr:cordon-bleu protein-like 1 isoform X2 [Salarias fasciatus]XP_029968398.1 cordon-bleu protein-like 1 isoform X2 [Salarias fasciatus]XP_029968399.1 cordon-bleu protein-like 1 isoform X2 [Salarias fasciatus]
MDQKENLIDKELSLTVVLPGGVEKTTVVHGSKPLMDLLVTLCAKYHLNPSSHTLELVTTSRNNVKLKPNALIGTLDAERIILKHKGEDKNKKTGPQMPEATVRMVINYKKTQKTILRVNPRVALAELLPAICEKCEFDMETTVLLRDVQSLAPLDLSSSLNDYAIREVYARDTKGQPTPPVSPRSPNYSGTVTPGKDKTQKEKENKGLFSKFRKSKKKSEQPTTASAPASPVLVSKPRPLSMALPSSNSSQFSFSAISADVPKKRRAPQPPVPGSASPPSEVVARQRLYSEPCGRPDSEMSSLSRGSSAESSLKKTKRKAPPPPTTPSSVVPPSDPQDENLQVDSAADTLEEIMEQEEMSAPAGNTQGVDSSPHMSPSPDVQVQSPVDGNGEDQSCDLSSDGNQLQSPVDDSAALSMKKNEGTDLPELADTNSNSFQVENAGPSPACEETMADSVEADCSAAPDGLPPPVEQETEAPASAQANTETLGELTDRLEGPAATSTSRPAGEDAQVQTDFTRLPEPLQQHVDKACVSASEPVLDSAGKKDIATLTEDLPPFEPGQAVALISEASQCRDPTPSATLKPPSQHATNSEPKPKPSNELTRDYIPKVGMTTYTIVPQKSLEKLRYFEVALTLETPPGAPEDGLNIGSLHLDESSAQGSETEVLRGKSEQHAASAPPSDDSLISTTTTQRTVNGSIPESAHLKSPASLRDADKISALANGASQAGSPAEVKEMKIPPATKPKPGSFRLAQHKKTPGYYVTSAAEKSLNAGPREAPRSPEDTKLPPPPPSPPAQGQEESAGAADVRLSPKQDDRNAALTRLARQSSLPSREPIVGLSLEKLRSFAAPRPYSPSTPSRFAQAVSSAVRRSHSLTHGPKTPPSMASPPVSPAKHLSPVTEPQGFPELQECESREAAGDGCPPQREADEPSFTEIVQVDGESGP